MTWHFADGDWTEYIDCVCGHPEHAGELACSGNVDIPLTPEPTNNPNKRLDIEPRCRTIHAQDDADD